MSIKRLSFRGTTYTTNKQLLVTSVLLILGHTIAWYYFLVLSKETFRIFSFGYSDFLLELSFWQNYFFNWFYANIAFNIGFSYGLKYFLENGFKPTNRTSKFNIRININNQFFQSWNYILWFTKLFSLYGVWVMGAPEMFFEIDLFMEFKYFFILFILVWQLGLLLMLYRLRIKKPLLYPFFILIASQIITLSLAFNNVIDVSGINRTIKSEFITTKYQLNIPEAVIDNPYYPRSPDKFSFRIYIAWSREDGYAGNDDNVIALPPSKDTLSQKDLDKIKLFIGKEEYSLAEMERDFGRVHLSIDSKVPYKIIRQLRAFLPSLNNRIICYTLSPKDGKYPKNFPGYRNYGLYETLPINCDGIIEQIDSIAQFGYTKKNLKFPYRGYCYRGLFLEEHNRIRITLHSDSKIFINTKEVSELDVFNFVYEFYKMYSPDGVILLDVADDVKYQDYIQLKMIMYNAFMLVREYASQKEYNLSYWHPGQFINYKDYEKMLKINSAFPFRLVEMTETDKYLYEFSKK